MKQALIIGSIIAAIILFVGLWKAKAKPQSQGIATGKKTVDTAKDLIIVNDHDTVYDYKKEAGAWYTKKKNSSAEWVKLYALEAINKLENFLLSKAS